MDDRPTVIVPMAGEGRRFVERGYGHPKFLLTVRGRPMLQWMLDGLSLPNARYLFVCQEDHYIRYALADLCQALVADWTLVRLDAKTQGAACTVLEALTLGDVEDDTPLWVANCDQWIAWDPSEARTLLSRQNVDGAILTTPRLNPQMSFARIAGEQVVEVAEKRPISPWATCGIYYFRQAALFRRAATQAMRLDKRVQGEFYVCPLYNELIGEGKRIIPIPVHDFWSLGTPEDLEEFRIFQCVRR